MKTIRNFYNIAEAQLAQAILETAGVESVLLDEHMFTLGPQYAHMGIRLNVAEEDVERARRILDQQEGFSPLPDDFVPPPVPPPFRQAKPVPSYARTFVKGGLWALFLFVVLTVVSLIFGGTAHADLVGLVILFGLGGIAGLIVRAIYKCGFDNGSLPH